jgi:hypothetical protein
LPIIRNPLYLLKSSGLFVDKTFNIDISISNSGASIHPGLAPRQHYRGGGDMGRYRPVFNPYKRHTPRGSRKVLGRKRKKCPWMFEKWALQQAQGVQDGERIVKSLMLYGRQHDETLGLSWGVTSFHELLIMVHSRSIRRRIHRIVV